MYADRWLVALPVRAGSRRDDPVADEAHCEAGTDRARQSGPTVSTSLGCTNMLTDTPRPHEDLAHEKIHTSRILRRSVSRRRSKVEELFSTLCWAKLVLKLRGSILAFFEHPDSDQCDADIIKLLHINRAWRRVALDTRDIWSSIYLFNPSEKVLAKFDAWFLILENLVRKKDALINILQLESSNRCMTELALHKIFGILDQIQDLELTLPWCTVDMFPQQTMVGSSSFCGD
ncbi:hypothetical protein D9613_012023 [Agrocybe pediades]|uniref:F-box domain-containing protein n=1 Tax=Agrocybe pediades TaxID=84607 RepID=A0A8H4VHS4_9AGAR|nr:hypothetical protein D9613_012023 [Agrocybe pediades]